MYMWEYEVVPEQLSSFETTYGPAGEWVQLFRLAPGYLRTELHRDRSRSTRFVTIDYWESRDAWAAFRARFAAEFETLDAKCEAWTTSERELGCFDPVS